MTIRAILFDTFGTTVDWRQSLIDDLSTCGVIDDREIDWAALVDAWRAEYPWPLPRCTSEDGWLNLDDLQRASLRAIGPRFGIPDTLPAEAFEHLVKGWHRLRPWPDSIPAILRLKAAFIVAPLSNGNVSLLLNMAKSAGLPWDMILATELFRVYKPDPEAYRGAVRLLDLAPEEAVMVAAHNSDLAGARAAGLRTAFFPRPGEYGPGQSVDLAPEQDWDFIAPTLADLADQLLAAGRPA